MTFTIPIGVKWIKVNSGQNGYYRVLYDEDNWGYIVEELKSNHETFSPMVKIFFIFFFFIFGCKNCTFQLDI